MAIFVSYTPTGVIAKALFNFDVFGDANFKVSGTVNVSVSDSFTLAQYLSASPPISSDIYTSLASGNGGWTQTQLANINLVTATYSNFINLSFSPVVNYSGLTPASVASSTDFNFSLISRSDRSFSGESAVGVDTNFGYAGSSGDVVLNSYYLGNDLSLNSSSFGFHVVMHEAGHSLGLSHPHTGNASTITADYSATTTVGFDALGFRTSSGADMSKEYFSIMSYDDQRPAGAPDTFAQTPMILDVIALQSAYGEGPGSSGPGNDVIAPGGGGGVTAYRTYFDTGGTDTIDLANYGSGAYLHMGTPIVGAPHLVGVSMSVADANTMLNLGGDPSSLRWFYGEFENAIGGAGPDVIFGNDFANSLEGRGGADSIAGGAGNDSIDGGQGNDRLDGGTGNDTLYAGIGLDTLNGGAGTDTVDFSHSAFGVFVWIGYTGDPSEAWSNGLPIGDLVSIEDVVDSPNSDFMRGDAGANAFSYGAGLDYIDGQGGIDTVDFSRLAFGVRASLLAGEARNAASSAKLTDLVNLENVIGTPSADQLTGNALPNLMVGSAGNDTLDGGGGGLDTFDGGAGSDTVDFSHSAFGVFVWIGYTGDPSEAWSNGLPIGDLVSIENVMDSPSSDFMRGDAGANAFSYGAGLDYIDGQGGIDTVDFSRLAFGVRATLAASEARNATTNVKLADLFNLENIVGSQSADQLTGDASANTLAGGAGNDTMAGGSGSDRFDYNANDGIDTVTDFAAGVGGDVLDISDVLAGYSAGVSNPASFVRLVAGGGNTVIEVNSDGVGVDFGAVVVLQNTTGLLLNNLLSQGNLHLA